MSEYEIKTLDGDRKLPPGQRFFIHANFLDRTLTPGQRIIMSLRMNCLSYLEIASMLHISLNTVKRQLFLSNRRIEKLDNRHPDNIVSAICIMTENRKLELTLESDISPTNVIAPSPRQEEILSKSAETGLSENIATDIAISVNTVKAHLRDLRDNFKDHNIDIGRRRLETILLMDILGERNAPFIKNRIRPEQILGTQEVTSIQIQQ